MYSGCRSQLTNGQMASWLEVDDARDASQSEEQRADGGIVAQVLGNDASRETTETATGVLRFISREGKVLCMF